MQTTKAVQGARDAGIGAAVAALLTALLCRVFPELDYATLFTVMLVVVSGLSRMLFNAWKHRTGTLRTLFPVVVILVMLPLASGCSTMDSYFEHRVDKGGVAEGGWSKTGIIIKMPGDNLTAGSLTLGREVGWGVLALQPLDENDAMFYEHVEGLQAGAENLGASIESSTTVRNEKQGYLGPERSAK